MNNVLVAIEKGDGKFFDLANILRSINLPEEGSFIYIVYFGSRDKEYIKKQIREYSNIKIIDIEKFRIDKKVDVLLETDTAKIINSSIDLLKEKRCLGDIITLFYDKIFYTVKESLTLKVKLEKIMQLQIFTQCILVGKEWSRPFVVEIYPFKFFNYYENLSALLRILAKDKEISFKLYKTDRFFKKKIYTILKDFVFTLGFLKKSTGYYIASNNTKEEGKSKKLILLRGKVHVKLASKLYKAGCNQLIFIFDSQRIPKEYLKEYFPTIYSNLKFTRISLFSVDGIIAVGTSIFDIIKKITIIRKEKKHFDLDISTPFLLLFLYYTYLNTVKRVVVPNRVYNYMTFEESNLFGLLFSQAIVPFVESSCLIQHGFTVDYYATMPLISNERWVWGEYFKEQYIIRGEDENRIKVKGRALLNFREYQENKEFKKIKFLIAPEYNQDISKVKKWIINTIESIQNLDTAKILISIHPNQPFKSELEKSIQKHNLPTSIVSSYGYKEMLDIDIIISGNTTVGFEAALLGKVVFFYNLKDEEILYDYVHHPYIQILREGETLLSILNLIDYSNMKRNYFDFLTKYAEADFQ